MKNKRKKKESDRMKSLSVKLGVILIGLAIFTYGEAWGADWKFFQVTKSTEEVGGLPVYGNIHFYDATSVVYPSKNIVQVPTVQVWTKTFHVGRDQTFPPEAKDRLYETFNSLKLPYTTNLMEINCSEKRFRSLKVFVFAGEEGVEKEVPRDVFPPAYESNKIVPKGEVDTLSKMLCK
jgi:hypothetical protein